MSKFSRRLKELRAREKWSQEDLAAKLEVSRSSIGMYESGKREPEFDLLEIIADIFNVDMDYLLGRPDYTNRLPFSPALELVSGTNEKPIALSSKGVSLLLNDLQSEYVEKYIELDEEGRGRVHNAIDYEIAKQLARQKPETVTLIEPSLPVCAGTGNYLDDNIEYEERTVLKNKYTYGATYIIKLQGCSMEPEFHDGDRLIVTDARGQSPIYGRVGIFIVNGNAIFRQPLGDVLHPYNPKYQDIVPTESDDVRYVGYVVGILDDSWVIEQ